MKVTGKRLRQESPNTEMLWRRLVQLIEKALDRRARKPIIKYDSRRRIEPGSDYYEEVSIDGKIYSVSRVMSSRVFQILMAFQIGDTVILATNDFELKEAQLPDDPRNELPPSEIIQDYFW